MRTKQELLERLSWYPKAGYIYKEYGYIAWQVTTGENLEILFIETLEKGKGLGCFLIADMLAVIKPYHSVIVFRLASNTIAGKFYRKCGFEETLIKGLYKGGDAVIGVATYEKLCQNLLIK